MSVDELREKYLDCAGRLLPEERVHASFEALRNLESCSNVAELAKLLEVRA
jgi:hypothetical protein